METKSELNNITKSFLENILNASGDPVFVKNDKSQLVYFNKAFVDITGIPDEDIIGKTLQEILPKEEMDHFFEVDKMVIETGEENLCEEQLTGIDGKVRIVETKKTRYVDEQGEMFIVGIIRDISYSKELEKQQEKSENKFRWLVENSYDIIYTLTSEGVFTFVSPAWTTLLGHPINQVVGQQFQLFVHPDDVSVCEAWLKKGIEMKQRQKGIEYRVKHVDGSWRWHTSSAIPLFDEAGALISFEGVARDVTEQKKNFDSIQNYMHILTHDLRSPLGPILGFSALLSEEEFSPEETKKFALMINQGGKKMLNLMESYLFLEKIERGLENLNKKPKMVFEIIDLVKKIYLDLNVNNCKLLLRQKTSATNFLDVNIFQKEVLIDEVIFSSVLTNLLKNAIEAVARSDKQVEVNIFEDGLNFCLSISNMGEISNEVQKNIFKKFVSSKSSGTGIGLYSAKLLAKAHGGELIYEPLIGSTRFVFSTPFE